MKVLLFPIETLVRELDFRLSLAVSLIPFGFQTIVAKHSAIQAVLPVVAGSMYVGKHLIRPHYCHDIEELKRFNEHSVRFTHFDTEGAVFAGDQAGWVNTLDSRLAPASLTPNSAIFTWGDFQARHYQKTASVPVSSVGNPVFDLLRPEYDHYYAELTDKIANRFSPFVLVNTSFARANHGHGIERVFDATTGYSGDDPARSRFAIEKWAFQNRRLTDVVELVDALARGTRSLNIVVRPHPSEDLDFYRRVFAGRAKIHVERSGSVGPWLKAAEVVIHNGCTTAVESWFAGTPAIQFEPPNEEKMSVLLPREVSHLAHSIEECLMLVDRAKDLPGLAISAVGKDLLANFSKDAFSGFAEQLQLLEVEDTFLDLNKLSLHYKKFLFAEKMKIPLRRLSTRHRKANLYASTKFPGFDKEDIMSRIRRANQSVSVNTSLSFIGEHMFVIGPSKT